MNLSTQPEIKDDAAPGFSDKTELAVHALSDLGYPITNIRKALPKLTDRSHPAVAKKLGVSRQAVTSTMNNARGNRSMQERLAEAYGVPVNVLFPERFHCACKSCPLAN